MSVHAYPVNLAYESAAFLIHSPVRKFLNMFCIQPGVGAKSRYFLSSDLMKSRPVLFCEYSRLLPSGMSSLL